jgi:hypothetical protein
LNNGIKIKIGFVSTSGAMQNVAIKMDKNRVTLHSCIKIKIGFVSTSGASQNVAIKVDKNGVTLDNWIKIKIGSVSTTTHFDEGVCVFLLILVVPSNILKKGEKSGPTFCQLHVPFHLCRFFMAAQGPIRRIQSGLVIYKS